MRIRILEAPYQPGKGVAPFYLVFDRLSEEVAQGLGEVHPEVVKALREDSGGACFGVLTFSGEIELGE